MPPNERAHACERRHARECKHARKGKRKVVFTHASTLAPARPGVEHGGGGTARGGRAARAELEALRSVPQRAPVGHGIDTCFDMYSGRSASEIGPHMSIRVHITHVDTHRYLDIHVYEPVYQHVYIKLVYARVYMHVCACFWVALASGTAACSGLAVFSISHYHEHWSDGC